MSTYAYCHDCAVPLDPPTLSDVILGWITCPLCDSHYELGEFARRMYLDDPEVWAAAERERADD
jgi:hypothetical protein